MCLVPSPVLAVCGEMQYAQTTQQVADGTLSSLTAIVGCEGDRKANQRGQSGPLSTVPKGYALFCDPKHIHRFPKAVQISVFCVSSVISLQGR